MRGAHDDITSRHNASWVVVSACWSTDHGMLQGCCGINGMASEHSRRHFEGTKERAGGAPSAFITLFMVRPLLPGLLLSRSLYPAPYTCTGSIESVKLAGRRRTAIKTRFQHSRKLSYPISTAT